MGYRFFYQFTRGLCNIFMGFFTKVFILGGNLVQILVCTGIFFWRAITTLNLTVLFCETFQQKSKNSRIMKPFLDNLNDFSMLNETR